MDFSLTVLIPFGVATFGFEPPMTPGLTDPVSSYLRIFLIFSGIQFFWQTWSEFWKRIHVKLAILLKYRMVWFRLLTFWRFLAEFITENLDVQNLYHELFPLRIAMLRGRPFTYRPPSWLTPPLLDVVL